MGRATAAGSRAGRPLDAGAVVVVGPALNDVSCYVSPLVFTG